MKWTLTIVGLDLGELIPKEVDLKPHDLPLEQCAQEVVHSLLNDLLILKLTRKVDACMEPDEVIKEALLRALRNDADVVQHMRTNFNLIREED